MTEKKKLNTLVNYRLSVIIPTFNRLEALCHTIKCLQRQDYPDFEVIIIDQTPAHNGNIPEELERLSSSFPLRYFYRKQPNASAARNLGILEATGDIVLFLDDDIDIERNDFLYCHARNYGNPKVAGVVGQILNPDKAIRMDRHPWSYRPRVGWLYFPRNYGKRTGVDSGGAGNLSIRKSVALAIGGMDENFEKGAHREEADFCMRCAKQGHRFVFDPEASIVHLGERTGGIRSWGTTQGLHPIHHVVGEMYFIIKNVELWDYPDHLFCALRRQVFNPVNMRRPWNIARALGRMAYGSFLALKLLRRGPKHLRLDSQDTFSSLPENHK